MGSLTDLPNLTDSTPPFPPFKVLIIGGAYGGLSAALNLQDLCSGLVPRCGPPPKGGEEEKGEQRLQIAIDVTVIDERDGFYHLIGSPLALADEEYAAKAWVKYDDIPALQGNRSIRVLHGSVQAVDTNNKIATYIARDMGTQTAQVPYDFLVVASGLRRPFPVVPQSLRRKQYLFEAESHIRAVTAARHGVVVVGGGAVGIEMAAELKLVHPHLKVTLVHSRDKLLSSEALPDEVKDKSLELLREAGVDVLLFRRLERSEDTIDAQGHGCVRIHFSTGDTVLADHVVMAMSKPVPTALGMLPASVLDDEGYVYITANLAVSSDPTGSHFAVGDVVRWSGIKRCGGAMHMGYLAANNIYQRMQQRLRPEKEVNDLKLDEIPPMIGLAVGRNAVAYWPEAGMTFGEDVMKAFFGADLGFMSEFFFSSPALFCPRPLPPTSCLGLHLVCSGLGNKRHC